MIDCPPIRRLERLLSPADEGEGDPGLLSHLSGCPECQGRLESLAGGPLPDPSHKGADDLDPSPAALRRLRDAARLPGTQTAPHSMTHASQRPAEAGPLVWVPGYEVLGELGRGGMGVVYKARQLGLNRVVALKVVRAERLDEQARQRFRHEAETVARLSHANVVQIHEVGEAAGVPFFSLEYAEGGSLEDALRGEPQPPASAARLVRALAEAAQYAHGQGVVHRDLKPGNVLLTADGTPKVADFGLARLFDAERLTRTGEIVGTPCYLAPEQANPDKVPIGPAADVWALGAILYEMLTGRPPFRGASVLDTLAQVCQTDPVAPRRLIPGVPRDLETICLKCLTKESKRRYASAQDLADDLGRFLAGEPIRARPVGASERAWRWCRRNPWLATATALAGFFLLAGTVTATAFALVANAQRDKAVTNLAEADRRRAQYREALDDQTAFVIGDLLGEQQTLSEKHRDFLRKALAQYEVFASEPGSDEKTRAAVARASYRVGSIRDRLGDGREAIEAYDRGLQRFRELAAEHPDDPDYAHQRAIGHNDLGRLHFASGDNAESEKHLRAALAGYETLANDRPDVSEYRKGRITARINLGVLFAAMARPADAETEYRTAIDLFEKLPREQAASSQLRHERAGVHVNLANLLDRANRHKQAEAEYRAGIAIRLTLVKEFANEPAYRHALATEQFNFGDHLVRVGNTKGAEVSFRAALAHEKQLAADFPAVPAYRSMQARIRQALGTLLLSASRREDAEAEFRAALQLYRSLTADHPRSPQYRLSQASSANDLGALLHRLNRLADAETHLRESLEVREKYAADFPRGEDQRHQSARTRHNLGLVLASSKRPQEAVKEARAALAVFEQLARDFPKVPQYALEVVATTNALAVLVEKTQPKEAEGLYRAALSGIERLATEFPTQVGYREEHGRIRNNLGELLANQGQLVAARNERRAALAIWQKLAADSPKVPGHHLQIATALIALARLAIADKQSAEARKLIVGAMPHHLATMQADSKDPRYREAYRANRVALTESFFAERDHAKTLTAADDLANVSRDSAGNLVTAAGFVARCVSLAEEDASLGEAQRKQAARKYGDRAIALLRQAIAAGFQDAGSLRDDARFGAVRSRAEFQEIVDVPKKGSEPSLPEEGRHGGRPSRIAADPVGNGVPSPFQPIGRGTQKS